MMSLTSALLVISLSPVGQQGHGDDGVALTVVGAPDTVFRAAQACHSDDRPDVYVHAVRTSGGILMFSGNGYGNYGLRGPDLDHLSRDCDHPLLSSGDNPDPRAFRSKEWISATYRVGPVIHALIHNEYHDPVSPRCKPGESGPGNPCWYNAVTYAVSHDDGRSFRHPQQYLVAPPTTRWDPERGAPTGTRSRLYGYFGPSSIVRGRDGYFYSTMVVINNPDSARGTCLIRTNDLADPASWRAWDGVSYAHKFDDPYGSNQPTRACTAVSPSIIADFGGSLTYNSYLNQYVLVGFWAHPNTQVSGQCGFAFALSRDLITWTRPRVFANAIPPTHVQDCPAATLGMAYYPALIDPADTTTNFEVTGRTPDLYYVTGLGTRIRNLVRIRVRFDTAAGGSKNDGR